MTSFASNIILFLTTQIGCAYGLFFCIGYIFTGKLISIRTKMDVDLSNIETLKDLYEFVDREALDLNKRRDLTNIFVAYRNQTTDETEKQKAQWEVESFLFWFKNGRRFGFGYAPGIKPGEVQEYPSLNDFQASGFAYLRYRSITASNPLLLARYHHLLWMGPKEFKHKANAYAALENYIAVIKHFERLNAQTPDDEISHQISHYAEILIGLTNEVKEKALSTKDVITRLLGSPALRFFAKHSIIEAMLELKGLFKPADMTLLPAIFEEELKKPFKGGDFFLWTNYYFKTAIGIARRLQQDINIWYSLLGDAYTTIGDRETEEGRNWLKYKAYVDAAQAYRKAGNKQKKTKLEQQIFDLKDKVKLPIVTIRRTAKEIKNLQNLDKGLKLQAAQVLKQPPEVVYRSLIEGWYYPSKAMIEQQSSKKEYFYEKYLTPVFFDANKNIKKQANDDHSLKKFYDQYHHFVGVATSGFLFYVLVPGIRSGHLTFENFIAYLRDDTWLGEPYLKTDLGGNEIGINWLSLLAPSLLEYFRQVQCWQWGGNYTPNFVLAIDSLTLKIEGLLRNFCERMQISTTVAVKDGTQEGYTHNLLNNETLNAYYSEDDRQFFRYLFVNEGGINLRNNVAHCFYNIGHYDIEKMNLLIAALIKVAQFGIDHNQDEIR